MVDRREDSHWSTEEEEEGIVHCVHTGKRGGDIKRERRLRYELVEGEEITKRLGVCCYKCKENAKQLICFSFSVLLFHASIFPQKNKPPQKKEEN